MIWYDDVLISGNISRNIRTGLDLSHNMNTLEMESSSTPAPLPLMKLITPQPSSHSNTGTKGLSIFLVNPGTKKSLNYESKQMTTRYKWCDHLEETVFSFQCRGWGTDLVAPHMSQIYNQQMNLHEQAARRESLSALALAISTPRWVL